MRFDWPIALKELDKGLKKFSKIFFYWFVFDTLLTVLPKLPDPIAKKIMDKMLSLFGLGE